MKSIRTPLSEIQADTILYFKKKISKKEFLQKYGHLRPGTYDITKPTYRQNNDFLMEINIKKPKKKYTVLFSETEKVNHILNSVFELNNVDFCGFIKNAISQREGLKFEFTKNLSLALDLITEAGNGMGFTKEEMLNLDISTILNYKKLKKSNLIKNWKKKIFVEKKNKRLNSYLNLPPIIFKETDFEIFEYFSRA